MGISGIDSFAELKTGWRGAIVRARCLAVVMAEKVVRKVGVGDEGAFATRGRARSDAKAFWGNFETERAAVYDIPHHPSLPDTPWTAS